ncbi:stage II sporulation protein M [Thermococcus chitonophagus]|nr:stage II sporulation protein M [Thermococcus chitonophagus]
MELIIHTKLHLIHHRAIKLYMTWGDKNMKHHLILFSFLLFFIGFIFGVSLSSQYSVPENVNFKPILELLRQKFSEESLCFIHIFTTNLKVALLLSFGGVLTFGGLTILNLIINSVNLGMLFYDSLLLGELKTFFLLILPHGIFEIPAIIIAGAAGFKIPYELLRYALGRKEEIITEEDAKEFFKLVAISIVLILIAALIESTITPKIAKSLG